MSEPEASVHPKRELGRQDKEKEDCSGGAVLVKARNIPDLHSPGPDVFNSQCVCPDDFAVAPSCVPAFQIDGVGADKDKNAVVEEDAVAP